MSTFRRGDRVIYRPKVGGTAYGYKREVPAEFVLLSKSGKRALIRFHYCLTEGGYKHVASIYVVPDTLRPEDQSKEGAQ